MTSYIMRRLLHSLIVIILITGFVFFAMHLLPGDPLAIYVTDSSTLTPEQTAALRAQYGLDQPLFVQYFTWMGGVLRGDLGRSITFQMSVTALVIERLPVSIYLGSIALTLGSILGIFLGTVCALRRGKWIDTVVTVLANIGITLPVFWVGIMLIYVFGLRLGLLPVYGYTPPFDDFWLSTKQIIMPVICLALFPIASLTRQTRSSMLDVVHQDYVRTAWAKGLAERVVVMRHVLKNGLIPSVTVIGLGVRIVVGGAVLTETVFNINGIGRMMTQGMFGRDYQVVQGGVLIIALVVLVSNLLVDLSYGWLDPRIRHS